MRTLFVAILLLLLPSLAVQAQEAPSAADAGAIRNLIEGQLGAFRRDDAGAAWAAASPMIQRRFMTPEFFMEVVRGQYPAVYRPKSFEFKDLRVTDGVVRQDVYLVGPDGKAVIATYEMERQKDGSWRINGVQIHDTAEIAV